MHSIQSCPCCGGESFETNKVLWPELINEWKLTVRETYQINRQQGLRCKTCSSNLRSMTLAQAILNVYDYPGTLESFCAKNKKLKILEINTAGSLTKFFEKMKNHVLAEYPEIDMLHLPYKEGSFDLVLHSDTLEHVELPIKALSECYRVLGKGGFMAYTVPSVVGRRNHRRTKKMKPSYHGAPGDDKGDYIVYTEYGDDLWVEPIMAGFNECRLTTIDYPSSVAISSRKH